MADDHASLGTVPVSGTVRIRKSGTAHCQPPRQHPREGRKQAMEDFIKFLMLVGALYSAYRSAKTAWRLSTDLFG